MRYYFKAGNHLRFLKPELCITLVPHPLTLRFKRACERTDWASTPYSSGLTEHRSRIPLLEAHLYIQANRDSELSSHFPIYWPRANGIAILTQKFCSRADSLEILIVRIFLFYLLTWQMHYLDANLTELLSAASSLSQLRTRQLYIYTSQVYFSQVFRLILALKLNANFFFLIFGDTFATFQAFNLYPGIKNPH